MKSDKFDTWKDMGPEAKEDTTTEMHCSDIHIHGLYGEISPLSTSSKHIEGITEREGDILYIESTWRNI